MQVPLLHNYFYQEEENIKKQEKEKQEKQEKQEKEKQEKQEKQEEIKNILTFIYYCVVLKYKNT